MKKKAVSLLLALVIMLSLVACGNFGAKKQQEELNQFVDESEEKKNFVSAEKKEENHQIVFGNDKEMMQAAYELLTNGGQFGDIYFAHYYIYDMNRDGKEEIIILAGTCEANATLIVYEYQDCIFQQIGYADGEHCTVFGNTEGDGIIVHHGFQGVESANAITIKNGQLKETVVIESREISGDYTVLDYCEHLDYFAINDYTPFEIVINGEVDANDDSLESGIDFDIAIIGSSAKKFIEDCNLDGILTPKVNSSYFDNGENAYSLKKDGTEVYYNLFRTDTTIAVRGDKIIGLSQTVRSQVAGNVFQLLKNFKYDELLNHNPEIIKIGQGDYYLKWNVKNAVVVVRAIFGGDDTTNWKRALPISIRIFEK